jgi:hypothetical protein
MPEPEKIGWDHDGEFAKKHLLRLGEALGITYEQMAADYAAMESEEERREREAVAAFWRTVELERRYWDAIINAEIGRIVFSIWIAGPGVEHIVGYNPQRLLTYQPEGR